MCPYRILFVLVNHLRHREEKLQNRPIERVNSKCHALGGVEFPVASQEENSNTGESSPSALFSKFGGSLFGAASGSPQKVVTNIRGFLSNRLPGAINIPSVPIPDTGEFFLTTSL
ncbi:hypothetical protein PVAND_001790 [Polypedilum vanderplanki]|uniref:Uncharacterized protein n=1 Tax=Polypedilum vanderplanki TaxID=319348 RepID=A0A9J6BPG9_POLVA|nr:hypothetical protein PVAND_001790 [Polypedilum vanderplanki]